MTTPEAALRDDVTTWKESYLSLLGSWTALCDLAGVEGDSSPAEVLAALAATPSRPDMERLDFWGGPVPATPSPPERFDRTWWHYADDCPATPSPARSHLDFCSGGAYCSLDDCLCRCHFEPINVKRLAEAMFAVHAYSTLDEAREMARDLAREYAALSAKPSPALDVDDLRARINTNLKVYQRRVDHETATDFDRGKRAAFQVVLSMLDNRPPEPTFSCGRPALSEPDR